MSEKILPAFQTEFYRISDVARVKDRWQQFLFIKHGAYPVDMYVSGEDLIMVFKKADTGNLYRAYRNHELE